jgi:predicted amidohydrolase
VAAVADEAGSARQTTTVETRAGKTPTADTHAAAGSERMGRRGLLWAAAGAAAAATGGVATTASAQARPQAPALVSADGTYGGASLRKPRVAASVIQSRLLAVDAANAAAGLRANVDHLCDQVDATHGYFGRKDLLAFHAFALQGWDRWDKPAMQKIAIELPGPESERLAAKAKEYACYIAFGAYVRDPAWPDHVLELYVLLAPDGSIAARHWKAFHTRNQVAGSDYFVTSIYDVYDEYVERYGLDAVIPVTRTDIGNICMTSILREPELIRCMALKGAEIVIRSGLGGYSRYDGELTSRVNRLYTLYSSNALSPGNKGYFPDNGMLGRSAIFGLRGQVLDDCDVHETAISATLEVAELRHRPMIPDVPMTMYAPVFAQYQSRFPPNLYRSRVPTSFEDAAATVQRAKRWKL